MTTRIAIIMILGAIMAIVLGSCSSQKRCARFVRKNPDCFKSTTSTRVDTFIRELQAWDTVVNATTDTVKLPTPCGDITITRQPDGSTRIHQKPNVKEIRTTETKVIQLPAPCDCKALEAKIKELRKQTRTSSWKTNAKILIWILLAFVIGFLAAVFGRK
jgi:hypothetical protein